jgi:hypothetical protein
MNNERYKNPAWAVFCAIGLSLVVGCASPDPSESHKPETERSAALDEAELAKASTNFSQSQAVLLQRPTTPIPKEDILVSGDKALKWTEAAWDENTVHRIVNLSLAGDSDWKQLGNKSLIVLACFITNQEQGTATRTLNLLAGVANIELTSLTFPYVVTPGYDSEVFPYTMLDLNKFEEKFDVKAQAAVFMPFPVTLEKDKLVRLLLPTPSLGVLGPGGFTGSGRIAFLLIGVTSEKGKENKSEVISNIIELPVTF